MRNRFRFPLLGIALISFLPGRAVAQSPQAPDQSAKPPAVASSKPEDSKRDYSQEAFVIEQFRSTYTFESDGTGTRKTVARIRVQSEAGVQQWGQIQEGYNSANERVEIAYVRVIKADGTVVKAGDDAVQDLSAPVEQRSSGLHRLPPEAHHRARPASRRNPRILTWSP